MTDLLDHGSIELLNSMGNDNTIVSAARVSYLGVSKGAEADAKLIKYLLVNKHTSPFEQVEFQFLVKCPVFVVRQWHRHRTWSYNEVSRRYTSEGIEFHIPEELRKQSIDNKQMSAGLIENSEELIEIIRRITDICYSGYEFLLDAGVCREQARMVLPPNLYTSFYAKVDLHNLLHFLDIRNHPHAQEEIRIYAKAIEDLIEPIVPVTLKIWKELRNE